VAATAAAFLGVAPTRLAPAAGVYLHGPVGSGKTALADLLMSSLAAQHAPGVVTQRLHFHELMRTVHAAMFAGEAVPAIGSRLGASASVLFVDEFQVTDIADAAILSRLTAAIMRSGCALLATSNRAPGELYEKGLNREVYIPAFEASLRESSVRVLHLDSPNGDYRRRDAHASEASPGMSAARAPRPSLFVRLGANGNGDADGDAGRAALRSAVEALDVETATDAGERTSWAAGSIELGGGRRLRLEAMRGRACVAHFDALCRAPLGAPDYLRLAERFDVLGLRGVRPLQASEHNEARRLITLIDIWYDQSRALAMSAFAAQPDELFGALQHKALLDAAGWEPLDATQAASAEGPRVTMRSGGGASSGMSSTFLGGRDSNTEWSATGRLGVSLAALSGLQDAAFAHRRAASRLHEMLFGDAYRNFTSDLQR
jgi:protein AFG1